MVYDLEVVEVEAKVRKLLNIDESNFPDVECRFYKHKNKIQVDFIPPNENIHDFEEKINEVIWRTLNLCPSLKLEKHGRLMIIEYDDIKNHIK